MSGVFAANPPGPVRWLDAPIPYSHPYDVYFKPCFGWTRAITLLADHRLFQRFPQFRTWSKEQHIDEATLALHAADALHEAHVNIVGHALITYGDAGPLVSGIVRDHFPEPIQTTLRFLAHQESRERARSLSHWKAAGKTLATWRRLETHR